MRREHRPSRGRTRAAVLAAGCAALLLAQPAAAVPDCPSLPPSRVIASDQGRLESIISDERGRLFYTDLTNNRMLRLDAPGQEPRVLAQDIPRPGGLAFDGDGSLVTGFNGGALSGVPGNAMGGLLRVDPETGDKQTFVRGLDQANGLVRDRNGAFYTSNNIGGGIVRVSRDGSVEPGWANVDSPNGLAIDAQERYLYAAQTFTPAKIARVDLADPRQVSTYFAAPEGDTAAGLDGLARDGADRLFVAANGASEVWQVGADQRACALARNLGLPSAVAFGGGAPGFAEHNLYVVTFSGRIVELERVTDSPPSSGVPSRGGPRPRLRVAVRPRRTRVGRRTRLRVSVRASGRPVLGANVRVGRRRAVTDVRGRARLTARFRRSRRVPVRASRAGYRPGRARIRVLPRPARGPGAP
jgi:gluconolactonase